MANAGLTPLAWKNFTHSKARMVASIGGVAFAVVLMFVEMGFLNGLFDSQTYIIKQLNADLVLMHRSKEAIVPRIPFSKKRLIQAKGVDGVAGAWPLYVEEYRAAWKNSHYPEGQEKIEHAILVYGFEPDDPVFLIPEVVAQASKLKVMDTALVDSSSKDFYGILTPGGEGELSRRRIKIVGTFPLGSDFRVDGNIIISDRTFFKCFFNPLTGTAEPNKVEFGLIKLAPGADPIKVQKALQSALPDDVKVATRVEFEGLIKTYWGTSKPVGYVFGLGTIVGFMIGVTICYQILYTDIVDHLPQYATLKAIGYGNDYLFKIVIQQSLFLAFLGFFPGWLLSLGLYALLQSSSGILMQLTLDRVLIVFVLTVVMCAVSGVIAVRKVLDSDPADVF